MRRYLVNEKELTPFEQELLKRFDKVGDRLEKLESCVHKVEENVTDTIQAFATDFSNQLQQVKSDVDLLKVNLVQVKNDTETLTSVFGFVRDNSGNLVRNA